MQSLTIVVICSVVLLCGCHQTHFVRGKGDVGAFILENAISYGGRPFKTNDLPTVGKKWQFIKDEFGVSVKMPLEDYSSIEKYLQSAFGSPPSSAGWSVHDIGVAIYLQRVDSNTQIRICPAMSDQQQAQMLQGFSEMFKKNSQ